MKTHDAESLAKSRRRRFTAEIEAETATALAREGRIASTLPGHEVDASMFVARGHDLRGERTVVGEPTRR